MIVSDGGSAQGSQTPEIHAGIEEAFLLGQLTVLSSLADIRRVGEKFEVAETPDIVQVGLRRALVAALVAAVVLVTGTGV